MSRTAALITICTLMLLGFAFSKVNVSHSGKNMNFQQESLASRLNITRKLHSNLNLSLRSASDDDYEVGRDFTVVAELSSDVKLQNVALSWSLPADLTLVSGELNSIVTQVQPGQTQLVEITVRGSSAENSKLFLRASLLENGMPFREIAQYNTVLQKQMDLDKAALAERTRENVESQLKIFK